VPNINIDRSLKNKDGKTAKELGEEKRGNIYFQIICKENTIFNNISINNQNKNSNINNNNLGNNENINNNIKTSKKGNDIFNKISANLINNANTNYENEKNYYDNIPQDNYVVPIEFNNVDYTTYLSMGQDMKLCLNLFKEEEVLIKEKEKLFKQKEDLEITKNKKDLKMKELIEAENEITEHTNEFDKEKEKLFKQKEDLEITKK